MKRLIIICTILILTATVSFSQEGYIHKRWNIKAGFSFLESSRSSRTPSGSFKPELVSNFRAEINYGINGFIETGGYMGLSNLWAYKFLSSHFGYIEDYTAWFYGANVNIHLLPFLISEDDFRFDLYLTGRAGVLQHTSPPGFSPHGFDFDGGAGPGASFYLFDHWGLYAEYTFGRFYFRDNHNLRFGLTIKF